MAGGAGEPVGSARLELVSGVALLREEDAVLEAMLAVEAYRFRRHLYYAIYAIPVSTPSSYSEGVRYPSPFCIL